MPAPLDPREILRWSAEEQLHGFQRMADLVPVRRVPCGNTLALPRGPAIQTPDVDRFMAENGVRGLLVLKDGRIRLEKYAEGFGPDRLWTSFSLAKSVLVLLLGAAMGDGLLALDDPVARFLPELAGGAYEGVTLRHLLAMTSGAGWNEDYLDPASDVAVRADFTACPEDRFLAFMAALPRKAPPGTLFNYSTGESNLLGLILRRACGQSLADRLSRLVWARLGMERDALWFVNEAGHESGGYGLNATLRDYGRFGLFMLGEAAPERRKHTPCLPPGWLDAALIPSPPSTDAGKPYGFHWWIREKGVFQAKGIFGQLIHIDAKRNLVAVMLGTWAEPLPADSVWMDRQSFLHAVRLALEEE